MKPKRLAFCLFVLGMLVALSEPLLAELVPAQVTRDTAAVLTETTQRDMAELDSRMRKATGVGIALVTRHFLGGAEVGAFARQLLEEAQEPENTLLVLLVIGEEKYAHAAGAGFRALLDEETINSLQARYLRDRFRSRDYDGAAGSFFSAVADNAGRSSGKPIPVEGLFGMVRATPLPTPTSQLQAGQTPNRGWLGEFFTSRGKEQETTETHGKAASKGENGSGTRSFVLLGIFLFFLFRRKRKRGKQRGIGLLGWIFGSYAVSRFFSRRK